MNKNINQQTREALMRALPHLAPRRRELVLSVLMSNPTINDWYGSWHQTQAFKDSHELDTLVYYVVTNLLRKSDMMIQTDWVARLNKAIDDIESRNPGP